MASPKPSPGGKVPSVSEADEECGWKAYGFYAVTDLILSFGARRSSSVFFVSPSSSRKIHLPPKGKVLRLRRNQSATLRSEILH